MLSMVVKFAEESKVAYRNKLWIFRLPFDLAFGLSGSVRRLRRSGDTSLFQPPGDESSSYANFGCN